MKRLAAELRARWRSLNGEADATRNASRQIGQWISARPVQDAAASITLPALGWPVRGSVTNGFAMRHGRLHEGLDLAAPRGTAVHPALEGVVIYTGTLPSYGNVVVVAHAGNYATVYAHLDSIDVAAEDRVDRERPLGTVGSTGRSFGPHLHFEVRYDGTPVDPLVLLREA